MGEFRIGVRVYLTYEAAMGIFWIVCNLIIHLSLDTATGQPFRSVVTSTLFHFSAPIAMYGVISQLNNNNSVVWWVFFAFAVSLGSEVDTLLQITLHVMQTPIWAWRVVLTLGILNIVGTAFAIFWYTLFFVVIKPDGIPKPAAFRNTPEHVHEKEEEDEQHMATASSHLLMPLPLRQRVTVI